MRTHLKNVYGSVCMASVSAGSAVTLGLFYPENSFLQPGLISQLAGLGLLIGLLATRSSKQNIGMRFSMLLALAFCIGKF